MSWAAPMPKPSAHDKFPTQNQAREEDGLERRKKLLSLSAGRKRTEEDGSHRHRVLWTPSSLRVTFGARELGGM